MSKKTTVIQGTPAEAGAEVWERFCLPALKAASGRPPREVAQFYAGVIGAAFGSLAADFGHEMAVQIAQRCVSQFARLGAELGGEKH